MFFVFFYLVCNKRYTKQKKILSIHPHIVELDSIIAFIWPEDKARCSYTCIVGLYNASIHPAVLF